MAYWIKCISLLLSTVKSVHTRIWHGCFVWHSYFRHIVWPCLICVFQYSLTKDWQFSGLNSCAKATSDFESSLAFLWNSTHPYIAREAYPFVADNICDCWCLGKYICWWIELLHFSTSPAVTSMVAIVVILLQLQCPVLCWNAFNPDMFSSNVVLYKSELKFLNWRLLILLSVMCEFFFFRGGFVFVLWFFFLLQEAMASK